MATATGRKTNMAVEEKAVIIVGAGPSGLATAACFHHLTIPYIILEREDCFASLWKKKSYDRLHLHLTKQFCELPHMPFPATYPTFLSKKDFLEYLDNYVSRFKINPMYQRSVEFAKYDETTKRWKVKAKRIDSYEEEDGGGGGGFEYYEGRFLVVATGENSDAFIPEVDGLSEFKGEVIHSTQYKNGEKYKGKNVLVVGSGNSGMEIALDLSQHGAITSIVVRSPMHILSKGMASIGLVLVKYMPLFLVDSLLVLLSKLRYGDLTKYGIKRPQEGPFLLKVRDCKYPIIDTGTCKKIKSRQIQVLPALKCIRGGSEVVFESGESHPFDAIVFATGFKQSIHLWLQEDEYLKMNNEGLSKKPKLPKHWKGKNGVYYAGLARRGLYGGAMDAKDIADDILTLL